MIDNDIQKWIKWEENRQTSTLEMIASENIISPDVMACLSTPFANKYSEWLPWKRYYSWQEFVDYVENAAIDAAKKIFGFEAVNVQPHSWSPANLAIQLALLSPGDTILSLSLDQWWHLSHGHRMNYSGKLYNIVSYTLSQDSHRIDMDRVENLAREHKPKMIIAWFSAYPRDIDWQWFARIAQGVWAYLLADISHTAGLIAGWVLPSPVGYADIIMTTTHKTLRWPRWAIIGCRWELEKKINSAVFPWVQGWPHMHSILAKLQAFREVLRPEFRLYAEQVRENAFTLAQALSKRWFRLITGGTDTHLILIDVFSSHGISGDRAQDILETIGISINKNMIPNDTRSALSPSGIRIGTPALTTRGCTTDDMEKIAEYLDIALQNTENNDILQSLWEEIRSFSSSLPIFSPRWLCP